MFGQLLRGRATPTEERAIQVTPWGDWGGNSSSSASGVEVSTDSSLNLLAVYGSTTLIADTIATLPIDVFKKVNGVPREVPKPRWLSQPNDKCDIVEFVTQAVSSLLLDGNGYVDYWLDGGLVTAGLQMLDPTEVQIREDAGRPVYWVKGQRFAGLMKHVKGVTRPGAVRGMSPVEAARQAIGSGLAAQEYAARFYSNGVSMTGVIQAPGPMTPKQAKELRENMSREHSGLARSHMFGVITNGATWQSISITPEQAQFLQTRSWSAAEICGQMFLLDPTMLGIPTASGSNLTYANLEQRGIHLVQFTLARWLIRMENLFTALLPKPHYAKFNVNALMRADMKTRYEAYQIGTAGAQFIDVGEVRLKEELPPKTFDPQEPAA